MISDDTLYLRIDLRLKNNSLMCNVPSSHRSALQLKDKWRHLVKYKHVVPEDFPSCIADCRKRQLEE